jgi:hypothetical protein
MELIHMTIAYSNAMLVAILPHVSDFAKKLDLPVLQPVTIAQVAWSRPSPFKGFITDAIVLTNRYWFSYSRGCVDSFRSLDNNPFFDDDPAKNWPHYAFGKDNMTTNEAIDLARDSLRKLGYDPKILHADGQPTATQGPFDTNDGHHVPYYEIRWEKVAETEEERNDAASLTFQVNMEKKSLIEMSIISRKIWQPDPKIDVVPELESDYHKRIQGKMFIRTNAPAHYGQPQSVQLKPEGQPGVIQTNSVSP